MYMFLSPTRGGALKASRMKQSKNFSNTRPLDGCHILTLRLLWVKARQFHVQVGMTRGKGCANVCLGDIYAVQFHTLSHFFSASSLVAPWGISFSTASPHSEVLRLSIVLKDSADIMLDDVDQYSCSNLARSPR